VGGEFPIVINTATGGTAAYSVTYKEFGVRLNFQPKISSNGEIFLTVSQEVSELDYANAVTLQGFRIPALKIRKAEAGLQLRTARPSYCGASRQQGVEAGLQVSPPRDIPILGPVPEYKVYQQRDRADGDGHAENRPSVEQGRDPGAPLGDDEAEETSSDLVW